MGFKFSKTNIPDIILIEPKVFGDERGFFMEIHNQSDFVKAGIDCEFIQDNHSKSKKGVFRGFHFQIMNTQAKLIRVTKGSVLDFVIDIRKNSSTYGEFIIEELTGENKKQLFIPKGFAHGFLTLEDDTEFLYKCDDYYDPNSEGGIAWDDQDININWDKIKSKYNIKNIISSDKDKSNPTLKEFYINNPF